MAVAKIICLDLGWHLEFRQLDNMSGNFLLVIPAVRYANNETSNVNNIIQSSQKAGVASGARIESDQNQLLV